MDKQGHDIVVIGASAGGFQALLEILPRLPADLEAAVFVVVHVGTESMLPAVLGRHGGLPCRSAQDGQQFENAHVYVAPPDYHMLVRPGRIKLVRGPKENRSRPAIDPLFRSAAVTHGSRVVGIVLSGLLMDGASGLRAIKRCGGLAIVQDPADALSPDMPMGALKMVKPDYRLPAAEIAEALVSAVRQPAGAAVEIPAELRMEDQAMEKAATMDAEKEMETDYELGERTSLSCPECGGPLSSIKDGAEPRYRCRIGHGYSQESLSAEMEDGIERALWAAVRQMEDHAQVLESLRRRFATSGRASEHFRRRLEQTRQDTQALRRLLTEPRDANVVE